LDQSAGSHERSPGAPTFCGQWLNGAKGDKTPDRWNRSEGHYLTHLYELIVHSQGTFASFSASAGGTVFGGALTGPTYASIGINRNVYMAVENGQ
jgi:hypothetical protein